MRNVDFFHVIQPQRYLFTEISTIKRKKTGIIYKIRDSSRKWWLVNDGHIGILFLLWQKQEWIFVKTQWVHLVQHLLYTFRYTHIIINLYIVWCLLFTERLVNDMLKLRNKTSDVSLKLCVCRWAHAHICFKMTMLQSFWYTDSYMIVVLKTRQYQG